MIGGTAVRARGFDRQLDPDSARRAAPANCRSRSVNSARVTCVALDTHARILEPCRLREACDRWGRARGVMMVDRKLSSLPAGAGLVARALLVALAYYGGAQIGFRLR